MQFPVPLPFRMAKLDRDRRGYPVPWIVFRDKNGNPHFTVNDERKRLLSLEEDRCSICGNTLLRGRWFVGGPLSALHPQGAYLDTPMHDECAHFALRVCPYLSAPRYSGRIDGTTLKPEAMPPGMMTIDRSMDPRRPIIFVAVMAVGQTIVQGGEYVRPHRPFRKSEFWKEGCRVGARHAADLIAAEIEATAPTFNLSKPDIQAILGNIIYETSGEPAPWPIRSQTFHPGDEA